MPSGKGKPHLETMGLKRWESLQKIKRKGTVKLPVVPISKRSTGNCHTTREGLNLAVLEQCLQMFVLSVATVLLHTCQFLLDYCTVHTRIAENIHVHKPPWKVQKFSEPWDYHIVMPAKRACLNSKSRPILDRMNLWSVVTAVKGANMCYDVVGRCHSWSSCEIA